jgi:hypothetical protein
MPLPAQRLASFAEFYPHYLAEHQHPVCRRLHVVGTALVLVILVTAAVSGQWQLLWLLPLASYGLAWIGHYAFEKNRPATFDYPLWSLAGDFVMFRDVLAGKVRW